MVYQQLEHVAGYQDLVSHTHPRPPADRLLIFDFLGDLEMYATLAFRPGAAVSRPPRKVRARQEPQNAPRNIAHLKRHQRSNQSEYNHRQFMVTSTNDNDHRCKHTRRNENENLEAQPQQYSSNCAYNKKDSHLPLGTHFTIIDRPSPTHPPNISLVHDFGQKKLD